MQFGLVWAERCDDCILLADPKTSTLLPEMPSCNSLCARDSECCSMNTSFEAVKVALASLSLPDCYSSTFEVLCDAHV